MKSVGSRLLLAICFGLTCLAPAQQDSIETIAKTISEIESILEIQARCWNEQDIEGFMATYWKSEKLTFSSGGRTTRGWQGTLDRYRRRYSPDKMGHLHFDNLETTMLSEKSALVLGQWHLNLNGDRSDGNFSLVIRKLPEGWRIIHDHSSSIDKDQE